MHLSDVYVFTREYVYLRPRLLPRPAGPVSCVSSESSSSPKVIREDEGSKGDGLTSRLTPRTPEMQS